MLVIYPVCVIVSCLHSSIKQAEAEVVPSTRLVEVEVEVVVEVGVGVEVVVEVVIEVGVEVGVEVGGIGVGLCQS